MRRMFRHKRINGLNPEHSPQEHPPSLGEGKLKLNKGGESNVP